MLLARWHGPCDSAGMLEHRVIQVVALLGLLPFIAMGAGFESALIGRSEGAPVVAPRVESSSQAAAGFAKHLVHTAAREIDDAIAPADVLEANRRITELHFRQGRELSALMGGEANFHTWAAHASNEVGDSMRMFLGDTWGTRSLRPMLWLFADRQEIVRAFSAGNRQVPNEVNRVTASFVEWVHGNPTGSFDDFSKIARERHSGIANFELVLGAYEDYLRAIRESDPDTRAKHAIAGNLRLAEAEQLALQPPLTRIFRAFGNGALHRALRTLGLKGAADKLRGSVLDAYSRTAKIHYGELEFRLRQPIPPFAGEQTYPSFAQTLTPSGQVVSKQLSLPESTEELLKGGVADWFSGPESRLTFIGTLFRQQHNQSALFTEPKVK